MCASFFYQPLLPLILKGLAFIMVMAFVGWIRGYRTQGLARSQVQLPSQDLINKVLKRFLPDDLIPTLPSPTPAPALTPNPPPAPVASSPSPQVPPPSTTPSPTSPTLSVTTVTAPALDKPALAKGLWEWCVQYWRELDLLSDREAEYLIKDKVIDCNLLAAPDAEKHISFFINTLDVDPMKNIAVRDLPPTTVLIPVYGEKLEFEWKQSAQYMPHRATPLSKPSLLLLTFIQMSFGTC